MPDHPLVHCLLCLLCLLACLLCFALLPSQRHAAYSSTCSSAEAGAGTGSASGCVANEAHAGPVVGKSTGLADLDPRRSIWQGVTPFFIRRCIHLVLDLQGLTPAPPAPPAPSASPGAAPGPRPGPRLAEDRDATLSLVVAGEGHSPPSPCQPLTTLFCWLLQQPAQSSARLLRRGRRSARLLGCPLLPKLAAGVAAAAGAQAQGTGNSADEH